ncbi:protein CLAVATA 3-like [Vicia villosa]|uniref:protein CLAVATA 3-like n=1 Tax=Vicia villosa TaxID=3911 RepID=UPI00273C8FF6|nr:protein CLAVATA 3-like [Vicia villosa]
MASKSIFSFVICLVFLFLFLMNEPHGLCFSTKKILNRKVLFKKRTNLRALLEGSSNGYKYGEKRLSWDELRKVPSGPDPLHHNGGTPKPETP